MLERGRRQLLERSYHRGMTTFPVRPAAMAVMSIGIPVEAHSHMHVKLVEEFQVGVVQQDTVCLDAHVHAGV